jgi:hypothetical protein
LGMKSDANSHSGVWGKRWAKLLGFVQKTKHGFFSWGHQAECTRTYITKRLSRNLPRKPLLFYNGEIVVSFNLHSQPRQQ